MSKQFKSLILYPTIFVVVWSCLFRRIEFWMDHVGLSNNYGAYIWWIVVFVFTFISGLTPRLTADNSMTSMHFSKVIFSFCKTVSDDKIVAWQKMMK